MPTVAVDVETPPLTGAVVSGQGNATTLASAGEATSVATALRATSQEGQGSTSGVARMRSAVWGSRSEFQRLGVAAVAALLVLGLVLGVGSLLTGGDEDLASSDFAAPPVQSTDEMSDHEICTLQVMAIAANEHDNQANVFETSVNGANDPFLGSAQNVQNVFWSAINVDRASNEVAYEKAMQAARVECGSRLGDAVRPNYPTDGTYPGQ